MKITDVSTRLIDQYMFVRVDTDEGISGVGESGAWAFLEASEAVVETFKRYLIGQNPLLIEHHWQYMYRCYHFRGAAIMGALSAIDIALWDIKGKYYGVPCYELLGGKVRHKARVYYHVFGSTGEELIRGCRNAKARGFTAVGHLTPFVDSDRREIMPLESFAAKISNASERVYQYREAVGNEVDLCIEIHRQLNVPEAIALGREIEQARPMFFEDPVRPDNFDDMEKVADKIHIPIATGERLHTLEEFGMLLSRNACQYIRPDVCLCGGITQAKKIAALAEARGVMVVPHNPLSPVSTAACIQLAAAIPNFAIQEYPLGEDSVPKNRIVKSTLTLKDGYLTLRRRKTGMPLSARVDGRAMQLLERYRNRDDTSPYLLCFLDGNLEGMAAYRDYQRILRLLNSRLRALALWKKVQGKVTSYSARHTWATVGRYCHIPIEVISEGLGHASVTTTEGYMKGFGNSRMDRANKVIMNYIFKG